MSVWSNIGIAADGNGNINMIGVDHYDFMNAVYSFFSRVKLMSFHGIESVYKYEHDLAGTTAYLLVDDADFSSVPKGGQYGFVRPAYKPEYDITDLAVQAWKSWDCGLDPDLWNVVLLAKPLILSTADSYADRRTGHPVLPENWEDPDFDPEEIEALTEDAFVQNDEEAVDDEKEKAVYIASYDHYDAFKDKISMWSQKKFDMKWATQRYNVIQRMRYVFIPMKVEYAERKSVVDDIWSDWKLIVNNPRFFDDTYVPPFTYTGKWSQELRYRFTVADIFKDKLYVKLCVRMIKLKNDDRNPDSALPLIGSSFKTELPYVLKEASGDAPEVKVQVFMLGDLATYEPLKDYFDNL